MITNADEKSALYSAVIEGRFGLVVKPGDAQAMADAIRTLLVDSNQRQGFGNCGRQYVAQFERSQVLPKLERVLQQVAEGFRLRHLSKGNDG